MNAKLFPAAWLFAVMVAVPALAGDRSADIEAGVRAVNAFVEARVRERPAEWWWVHKRWPAAVYAELAAAEKAEKAG